MRIGALVVAGAITLVLAAIIHLATVMAVPYTAPRDAWSRLAGLMEEERVARLPPARPGEEILPLLDPNLVYGVCRFDVSEGPFAISAPMPPAYWAISLQTPRGHVFYAIDDEAALDGALEIELRSPEAMRRYQLARAGEVGPVIAVEAPSATGYVLMRALVGRGARREVLEAMMDDTFCGQIEETALPEPEATPEPERPRFPFPPPRPEMPGRD
ncbi:DUF1254 domain-containing protein [Lutibaculum baratangense]|uniref:DUF1254 domain-containing protein n=1 Tax=Lutibaculum baratangense AMV1 TaxID=631454 RepID=V4QSM3_9HYPH|nr:DUF1254 domain-containing protein [Lutibaculum baratangense]ESR22777.1 hypothetical protein N177_3914 [Lutibaculum baratangense AMV1]